MFEFAERLALRAAFLRYGIQIEPEKDKSPDMPGLDQSP